MHVFQFPKTDVVKQRSCMHACMVDRNVMLLCCTIIDRELYLIYMISCSFLLQIINKGCSSQG